MNVSDEKIRLSWENFQKGLMPDDIRPEVLSSWIRSKRYGVDPYGKDTFILNSEELNRRIRERKTFFDTAYPFLQKILDCISGKDYWATLYDEEGYALSIVGNHEESRTDNVAEGFIPGCNRSEKHSGTLGLEIAFETKQPIELRGCENYHIRNHDRFVSTAPIFDYSNTPIGAITMSGDLESDQVHPFSLTLVSFAADAITKQLKLQESLRSLTDIKNNLSTIIETIDNGIILINASGIITQINQWTAQLFEKNAEEIIGKHINLFIDSKYFNPLSKEETIFEKEVLIERRSGTNRFSLTARMTPHNINFGYVISIREIKSIHKLVNKIIGTGVKFQFTDIIGESEEIKSTINKSKIAAQNNSTVLLLGESGTGKELFAQSIHTASNRKDNPFIAINCAAIPRNLIESELFGYESGAFTGSKKDGNPGKFELANGGTLFLDEIGDMPFDVQASILRVLQNKEIVRIGGVKSTPIDVRIIAATNVDLERAIENKTFRSDLYYRINVFSIEIPPLRVRKTDISYLAEYFLEKYAETSGKPIQGFTGSAMECLNRYDWPGNVRELENVIERAVLICEKADVDWFDLPENMQIAVHGSEAQRIHVTDEQIILKSSNTFKNNHGNKNYNNSNVSPGSETNTLQSNSLPIKKEELELLSIKQALSVSSNNISKAAKLIGISRKTLYRKMEKYDLAIEKKMIEDEKQN